MHADTLAQSRAPDASATLQLPFKERLALFWRLLVGTGSPDLNALGDSLVRDAARPEEKVYLPAAMSLYYEGADAWTRGADYLAMADEASRSWSFRWMSPLGASGYWRHWALRWLESARCRRASERQDHDGARLHCDQAVAHTEAAAALSSGVVGRLVVDRDIAAATILKALVEARAGRLADAELSMAKAESLLDGLSHPAFWILRRHFLRDQVHIFLAQGRLQAAIAAAQRAVALAEENGTLPQAPRMRELRQLLQDALVAGGRWEDAKRAFERQDDAGGWVTERADRSGLMTRALVWMHFGRLVELEGALHDAAQARTRDFGGEDMDAAIYHGLAVAAVLPSPTEAVSPEHLRRLRNAVIPLLDARHRDDPLLRLQNRAAAARAILQQYVLHSPPSDALAFEATEALRSARLQRSIGDAAVRAAARLPGVADLVRQQQDARSEAEMLRRFIDERSLAPDGSRIDTVLATMQQRVVELAARQKALQQDIARLDPGFEQLVRPQRASPSAIQGRLDDGEAFVSLVPAGEMMQLWVIRRDAVFRRTQAISPDTLRGPIEALRHQVDSGQWDVDAWPAAEAHRLYKALLEPLAPALEGVRTLVIAADGVLAAVPYAALLTGPRPSDPGAAWPWLVRRHAVSLVPSAAAWLAVRQGRIAAAAGQRQPLLAWGDPRFAAAQPPGQGTTRSRRLIEHAGVRLAAGQGRESVQAAAVRYADIPALPETRDELQAIAAALGADPQRDLILGEAATRASVLTASASGELSRRRVVAFATHGLMAGDLPNLDQPALAMAATPEAEQDPLAPLLKLDDVLGLKLNADWVVLSACNTAAADGKAEEALSGLARGFFYAGARSLLVTHWAVETESAKLLTTGTFEHYASHPEAGKAESLRQAMIKVMADPKYAHPAFWAPYALVGDGGR